MEEILGGLRHLLTIVFLSAFADFLVKPGMTDVTVAAVCSDPNDSCSLAVYLTGVQQVTVGLGTMIMMPVIGNLADMYGIKTLLTLPMCLSIIPPAILGYRSDRKIFYAFYIIKTLFDMVSQGSVCCLARAYVAKNIHGQKRISMFGIIAGVQSLSGICATFVARFLPTTSTFQVSALSFFVGLVYMRVSLKERLDDDDEDDYDDEDASNYQEVHDGGDLMMLAEPILRDAPIKTHVFNTMYSSWEDMVSLIKNSTILVRVLVVTFFAAFSQSGMESALMVFLISHIFLIKITDKKTNCFFTNTVLGYNKNDFAEYLLWVCIITAISQLFLWPMLASGIGERKLLSTGLLMEYFHATIISVIWSPWVLYAATLLAPGNMFVMPSVYGIASKQVGSSEQGKVQGCISGIKSFVGVVAPFVYSPLTALFLSKNAPFYFPGFSILCVSLSWLIGFLQSLMIKDVPSPSMNEAISNTSTDEA